MFVHPPAWGGLRFALVILVVDLRPPFFPCIHPSTRPTQSNRHDRTTTEGTLKRCYGLWQSRQLKDDVHGRKAHYLVPVLDLIDGCVRKKSRRGGGLICTWLTDGLTECV